MATWFPIPQSLSDRSNRYVLDENGPYVYYVSFATSGIRTIYTVSRTSLLVLNRNTFADPFASSFVRGMTQDTSYIYIGFFSGSVPSGSTSAIIKIRKSDLGEEGRVTYVSDAEEDLSQMLLGRGWGSDRIWGLLSYDDTNAPPWFGNIRLVSWDINTLALVDDLHIVFQDGYGSTTGPSQPIMRVFAMAIDATGDIYLLGSTPLGTSSPAVDTQPIRIAKVDSSLTLSTFVDFPVTPDAAHVAGAHHRFQNQLFWDDVENALTVIVIFNYPDNGDTDSGIIKMNASGTTTATAAFSTAYPGVPRGVYNLFLEPSDIRTYNGARSYFVGSAYSTPYPQADQLLQINPSDLSTISSIAPPSGYWFIGSAKIDADGLLWAAASDLTGTTTSTLFVYGDGLGTGVIDEKLFAYGMTAGLGRGWA